MSMLQTICVHRLPYWMMVDAPEQNFVNGDLIRQSGLHVYYSKYGVREVFFDLVWVENCCHCAVEATLSVCLHLKWIVQNLLSREELMSPLAILAHGYWYQKPHEALYKVTEIEIDSGRIHDNSIMFLFQLVECWLVDTFTPRTSSVLAARHVLGNVFNLSLIVWSVKQTLQQTTYVYRVV